MDTRRSKWGRGPTRICGLEREREEIGVLDVNRIPTTILVFGYGLGKNRKNEMRIGDAGPDVLIRSFDFWLSSDGRKHVMPPTPHHVWPSRGIPPRPQAGNGRCRLKILCNARKRSVAFMTPMPRRHVDRLTPRCGPRAGRDREPRLPGRHTPGELVQCRRDDGSASCTRATREPLPS